MAYIASEARRQLLDDVAEAVDRLGVALGALGEAYEMLDEHSADRLEEELFRPVQVAYGRAQATHAGFAERHGLPGRTFEPAAPSPAWSTAKSLLAGAVDAVGEADLALVEIQDSMKPVEVGDAELRAGLSEVRGLVDDLRRRTREFVRVLGR